jgi:biopolymer transport protein ExbD
MSMSVGAAEQGAPMMEINTTPLIDVMLVLIIVLIMSIPVMTHATKLDMPQTNNPPPLVRPEVIQIDIDFDGTIVWNGTVVSGIPQLESFFRSERGKDPQPEIHLRPDRRSRYETTALVMAAAQRNHMKKMGFVNISEFRD